MLLVAGTSWWDIWKLSVGYNFVFSDEDSDEKCKFGWDQYAQLTEYVSVFEVDWFERVCVWVRDKEVDWIWEACPD